MKKSIITTLLALFTLTGQTQVSPTTALLGSWSGKLKIGVTSLTIVLHLEQADGYVTVSLDSPDQGAKGISGKKEYLSDDSIAVKVESIGASYRARLKDGKLEGTFSQSGLSLPLVMTKGVPEVKRPQMPNPPYPYETEEVTFTNEADGATLAGTLTYPVGYDQHRKQKITVVLLVSGSGQQNRDEELMNHKPFLVIADFLARQGIATLRYDDRATGKSVGGEVKNATPEDFMRDAAAGISFLRNKKAFDKVGILGHSEGGTIAFMLGGQKKVDFIVSMAGPTVKGDTLLAAQSNRILSLSGQPATMTVEKYRQTVAPLKNRWIDWFNDYDPSDNIRKTRCPVFALNGDRDCQVISSLCLPALKQLLPTSKKHLIKEYPSLNHLFQHCTTGLPEEYSQIEETISPEVLQDMAEWIKALNSNKATSQQWCFPLPGAKVISPYGKRGKRSHSGVDIKTKDRDSIYAAFDGEVVFSKPYHGYGNLIRIKHANGLETCYSHNSENLVKEGQHVKAGQVIALVGQTGRATTPHLHFEIRVNGKARNPANYFDFKKYVYRKR